MRMYYHKHNYDEHEDETYRSKFNIYSYTHVYVIKDNKELHAFNISFKNSYTAVFK